MEVPLRLEDWPSLWAAGWERKVHWFRQGGLNLVLDVASDSLHLVDNLGWNLLEELRRRKGDAASALHELGGLHPPREAEGALEELSALVGEGLLASADDDLLAYRPPEEVPLQALCLHVAHDCNLRCRYCFAGKGSFGGRRGLMTTGTGRAALDLLFARSGPTSRLNVDFFGGEPLLNFPLVRELVSYGKELAAHHGKAISFTLTTNGVLLTPAVQNFLEQEQMQVVLSLDGRPEVHNAMRPYPDGRGSYHQALAAFRRLVQGGALQNYYVRGTYTRLNLDFAADALHIIGLGFNRLSLEPVVEPADVPHALRQEDLPELCAQYDLLAETLWQMEQEGRPVDFYHFNLSLDSGLCLPKRLAGCGAGSAYLAVTPEGRLYPCHQFVGRTGFELGDVRQGMVRLDLQRAIQESHAYSRPACRDCWARLHCGGGCHANNQAYNGSLNRPYELGCALQRKRLECALYLAAQRKLHEAL